ncbi:ATP-binding protein [Reichenbachiella carrageenanivorans]|uniref:ATP-binding protein n=1 Tax=Reichenbachiella carrageenanivorans TaxID=2979869 RepID=A0ABY6D027_9BACT|nr:ATP-binding protein [Reichenbachiella carrageenanivorans]UXX78408.1 ATP-binding protein [Reichenbachiella carrageenanivorans]
MEKISKSPFKVVITGPECSGKSTLSKQLSEYFEQPWVTEYARTYLSEIQRPYQESDLLEIAKGQIEQEDQLLASDNAIVFIDTSLEVIKVWSEWKYDRCDAFIQEQLSARAVDLYLLLSPDMAWEDDPLRENPHDRSLLFDIYKKEIEALGSPYEIISGHGLIRTKRAIKSIHAWTSKKDQ